MADHLPLRIRSGLERYIRNRIDIALWVPMLMAEDTWTRWLKYYARKCRDIHYLRTEVYRMRRKSLSDTSSSQEQSMLLSQLPLELRQLIYEEVFVDLELRTHFVVRRRHLSVWLEAEFLELQDSAWHHTRNVRRPSHLLALPLTCRQMYCETIAYLYSHNTLYMHSPAELHDLQSVLPPRHFAEIRSLEIDWTGREPLTDLWTTTNTMPKLRNLCVEVHALPADDELPWDMTDLKELTIVFRLWKTWQSVRRERVERLKTAPFRLKFTGFNDRLPCAVRTCNMGGLVHRHFRCDVLPRETDATSVGPVRVSHAMDATPASTVRLS